MIVFGLYQSCGNKGSVARVSVFGLGRSGLGVWGGVMSVCVVSLDYLCILLVHAYAYCARRIPTHL